MLAKIKSRLLIALTLLFAWIPSGNPRAGESQEDIYAVVEVGSSGIKGQVVQIVRQDPESPPIKLLKPIDPLDANAFSFDASASGKISAAVAGIKNQIQEQFKLPDDHFFVVGSSGIPVDVRGNLSSKIYEETGKNIEYATPEMESDLLFRGIVPTHRLSQAIVLDIGSGNSRGAYVSKIQPNVTFSHFGVPWGTKTCASEINKIRRDGDFLVAADAFCVDTLIPAVENQLKQSPGMQTLRRIYLTGGIAWAMATLTHPYVREGPWVRIAPAEITAFYEKATTDPGHLLHPDLTSPPVDVPKSSISKANEEVSKISKVFGEDQITAGAFLLKTFADEMHFDQKDAIFFRKDALYAWPQGYILQKISAKGKAR
jgi:hypothetical protein